jgi:hypothetical protein
MVSPSITAVTRKASDVCGALVAGVVVDGTTVVVVVVVGALVVVVLELVLDEVVLVALAAGDWSGSWKLTGMVSGGESAVAPAKPPTAESPTIRTLRTILTVVDHDCFSQMSTRENGPQNTIDTMTSAGCWNQGVGVTDRPNEFPSPNEFSNWAPNEL